MSDFPVILRTHAKRYPLMQPCDAVKLLYQHVMGGGHLIADVTACLHALRTEYASLPEHGGELLESIGHDRFRLNLAALDEQNLPLPCLCKLFVLSSEQPCGHVLELAAELELVREATRAGLFSFDEVALEEYLTLYRNAGYPAARHSESYRRAYRPAYRVLDGKFVRLLPVIERINLLLSGGKPVVVAIDGCAASGKTTTAGLLSQLYESAIVHMDDFFLPFELRTPERLAEPGGNVDHERFLREVIPALRYHGVICHRVFDCSTGGFSGKNTLPAASLTIVEGVYSHHPALEYAYDLRVFLRVSHEEQRERILRRNGDEMAQMFFERWIPMENQYFSHFHVCEHSDIVVEA